MVPPTSRARSITASTSSADATLCASVMPPQRAPSSAIPEPAAGFVGETGVCRQLLPRPEDEQDAVRLEEGGLLDLEHRLPPERRVERVRLCRPPLPSPWPSPLWRRPCS